MKLKLPVQAVRSYMALCHEFCLIATADVSAASTSLVGLVPNLDCLKGQFKNPLSTVSSWIIILFDSSGRPSSGQSMELVFATSRGLITNQSTN